MSCIVKPENHQLWDELFEYLGQDNRKLVKYWYTVAHDQEFLDMARDELEFNSEGEPTFASLMRAAGTSEYAEKIKQKLGEQLGVGEMTYDEAIERLQTFNRSTPFKQEYMATITPSGDKVILSIVDKTTANQQNLHKYISQRSLQDRIKYYLNKAGVDYSFLEDDSAIDGRYSTENVERTANGLATLIRVSNGERTTSALAEEAGHFAIGALGNSPLVSRLLSQLNETTMRALLGEEYDKKNLGSNPQREVAGYLVGQAILNNVDQTSAIGRLANRILDAAKRIFAKMKGDTVEQARLEAKSIADKIARSFMSEDFEGSIDTAMEKVETLYSREKSGAEQLFNRFQAKIKESQIVLRAFYPERAKTLGVILDEMEAGANWGDTFAEASAMEGLAKAMMALSDVARDIQDTFESIDDDFSDDIKFWDNFYRNGKNLRFCSEYCLAVAGILDEFDKFTSRSAAREDKDRLPSDLSFDMYDGSNGVMRVNLKTLADNLNVLLRGGNIRTDHPNGDVTYTECRGLFSDVQARKVDFFTKFCEVSLGRKYIIRAQRVLAKGLKIVRVPAKKVSVRQMIDELSEDTTMMGRLFGSMGNSSDVISQIVFKAYKTARKRAELDVIDVQDRLRDLMKDAKALGVQDERLYCARVEHDLDIPDFIVSKIGIDYGDIYKEGDHYATYIQTANGPVKFVFRNYLKKGALTGNVASLYDEARYEWEYDEFKRFMTAKFKAENPQLDPNSQRFLTEWEMFFKGERKAFFLNTHHREGEGENKKWVLNDEYVSREYAKRFLKVDVERQDWEMSAKIADTMSGISPEKTILEKWLSIKAELDARIPMGSTTLHRLPQFRGDYLDRLRNEMGAGRNLLSAAVKVKANMVHEAFSYDTSQGDYGSDLTYTMEEEQLSPNPLSLLSETVNRIPLYGINRMEDTSRLSTDIFQSLLSYATMACNYESMDYISHALEIGKSVLGEHRTLTGDNGEIVQSNRSSKGLKKIYDKIFHVYDEKLRKDDRNLRSGLTSEQAGRATGLNLNVYCKYAHFLDKQLYGHNLSGYLLPGSELAKRTLYKWAKGIGAVTGLSSILALGGSITVSGVSLLDGINEIMKEAHSGEHFNKKDILKAHMSFMKYMIPNWLTYAGVRFTSTKFRDDKMSLLIRQFNIDENNTERFRNWSTKNRLQLGRLINDSMYLPMEAGTVYMNVIPYVALMQKKQLYTTTGRKRSLWDAYRIDTSEGGHKTRRLALDDVYFTSRENADMWVSLKNELDYMRRIAFQIDNMVDSDVEDYLRNLGHTIPQEMEDYFKSKGRDMVDDNGYLKVTTRQELNQWINAINSQMGSLTYNEQDEAEFMAKARQLVNNMHGIYDRDNKGSISQSLVGQAWSCMKGYMFGMIGKAYTGNRYNIFNERDTGETFTDENGETVPMLDGETEGYVLSTYKTLRLALGSTDQWGTNFGRILGASLLATLGVGTGNKSWGTEALRNAGMSSETFSNLRRMAASILASVGMGLLINLLKGLKGDDDELEEGNPYSKIKIGDIKSKNGREIVKKCEEMWNDGVDPEKNYFAILAEHPEQFKTLETYETVKKLAKIYDEGRNRTCNDQRIDWPGLGIYFLSRCQRDNNAFISPGALFGDKDSPTTQEIQGATSIVKSTIAVGMMGSLWDVLQLSYGDMRYGGLQNQKIAFLNRVEQYQKHRKEKGLKYLSRDKLVQGVINYYESTGTMIDPFFEEDKEFISFMSENKGEYASLKELDKKLLNKYYFTQNTKNANKGDARWITRGKSLIPWVKAEYLLYHPEESLESYMFAVRNQ